MPIPPLHLFLKEKNRVDLRCSEPVLISSSERGMFLSPLAHTFQKAWHWLPLLRTIGPLDVGAGSCGED
jgi:hypothetical protein